MTQVVRIAFAGLGDHALRSHLKHLINSDKCKVVGAFSLDLNSFDISANIEGNPSFLEVNGLDASFKKYGTYRELLADKDVDAVLIASPDQFHLPQLKQAVEAGKHVFCEKPLCTSQEELPIIQAILKDASEKGLKVSSCHPRRFDPPYIWTKENLGELVKQHGKVLSLSLDFSYHEPSDDKSGLHGGSLLLDHANHEIDYTNFLLGRSGINLTRLTDSNDQYALSGIRDDGVIIHFHGSRRLATSIYPEKIHIRFDRAELEINTYDSRLSRLINHEEIIHQEAGKVTENTCVKTISHPVTDYNSRFLDVNNDWLDSIRKGKQGYLSNEDMIFNTAASVGFGKNRTGTLRLEAEIPNQELSVVGRGR